MKITHQDLENLNSLLQHPGWKFLVSVVQEKVQDLETQIDDFQKSKSERIYNRTEVLILRKLSIKEVIGVPEEVTTSFRIDKDIERANKNFEKLLQFIDGD